MVLTTLDIATFCISSAVAGTVVVLAKRSGAEASEAATLTPTLQIRRDKRLLENTADAPLTVRFDQWLESILIRSGMTIDCVTYIVLLIAIAVSLAAGGYVLKLPIVLVGIATLAVVPIGLIVAYVKMKLRLGKFEKQFPASLELLARATRAGESLGNAFKIAAESSEEPVKSELSQCVRQMNLGMSPTSVVGDLARRVDSSNVHLLSHAITIHHELGGRLAESLDRLSTVIHSRSECEQKIKSMTSIGRFAILAIVVMGIFVLVYLMTAEPDYISNLFESSLGHKMLAYAAVSELVGLVWVGYTLKSDL
ncbi:type II secretion system F family protein [Rhodopirellula sp. MGV]|uniref:type II secretion system F family protein n=1 Tax=Rhodopirellula sp. MGV TaxID=2023130 RepID=UPI0013040002|nr:type II secretion system F family protein [Rhodopirellula sp. MGV]